MSAVPEPDPHDAVPADWMKAAFSSPSAPDPTMPAVPSARQPSTHAFKPVEFFPNMKDAKRQADLALSDRAAVAGIYESTAGEGFFWTDQVEDSAPRKPGWLVAVRTWDSGEWYVFTQHTLALDFLRVERAIPMARDLMLRSLAPAMEVAHGAARFGPIAASWARVLETLRAERERLLPPLGNL